jgi:hypothetical protein
MLHKTRRGLDNPTSTLQNEFTIDLNLGLSLIFSALFQAVLFLRLINEEMISDSRMQSGKDYNVLFTMAWWWTLYAQT